MNKTKDPEIIKAWIEKHGGKPVAEKLTTGEEDIHSVGIKFKHSGRADSLVAITWDEFFRRLAEKKLLFAYEDVLDDDPSSHFSLEPADDEDPAIT